VARATSSYRSPRIIGQGLWSALLAGAIFAAISAVGCQRETPLRVHYLPGFVPATQHVLSPLSIVVLPAGGPGAAGKFQVGAVYGADGSRKRTLVVRDLGALITQAVKRCLSDAGLKAAVLTPGEVSEHPPLAIATEIESVSVNQHFGRQRTIHGQYFSMTAHVQLRFTVADRMHHELCSTVTTGIETEPPVPVGGEAFLPLETDPAESLSVALSRAIGMLILQPEFRRAIQSR
jgi:hypothetical protein